MRRPIARTQPETDADGLGRARTRLLRAPVVIVVIVTTDPSDPVRAREDRDAVAAATQNLLLAAHGRGLGAMWRTGAIVDEPEVHDELGLHDDEAIVAFVYLGLPAVDPPVRTRRPLADVVDWMSS